MIKHLRISALLISGALLTSASFGNDDKEKAPDLPLEGKTERLEFTTEEGSWLTVDVMPNGESLLFDLLGDLYTLPIAGGSATRITEGLGFDSQPNVSPDGQWIAFISDRNGANNVWIARPDGSDARMLSDEKHWRLITPEWTPDSQYVLVAKIAEKRSFSLYHIDGGSGVQLAGDNAETKVEGVGAVVSPDGRFAYFSKRVDGPGGSGAGFPVAQVARYDFVTGAVEGITQGEGGGFRPVLSPDGVQLVYGTRYQTKTGLRIRNLETGADRWLTYPVQRDAQENFRPPSRDVLPGYAFTPDGNSLVMNFDGRLWRIDVATGDRSEIPFSAEVGLDIGPDLTAPYRVPQGNFTATIVHDPRPSPDGSRIAASVMTKIYLSDGNAEPERLTDEVDGEYKPIWSPDGRWITYVTWDSIDGGHIYRMRSNGRGQPQRLTEFPAFYTDPVYSPDGETIYAMRANAWMRQQTFSEFGGLRVPLELIALPGDGGEQQFLMAAGSARTPHFGAEDDRIYMTDEDGLFSVNLIGADRREELVVTVPRGNRGTEEPPKADSVLIHPDGRQVLVFAGEQLWITNAPRTGGKVPTVALRGPSLPAVQLTDIGAEYFGWTADGASIWWAIGSSYFERPLDSIEFRQDDDEENDADDDSETVFIPKDEHASVRRQEFEVVQTRDTPLGSMLIRGANVIAMSAPTTNGMDAVLADQDLLITDNRIAAIGDSGTLTVPSGTETIDAAGKFIVPGFVDTHAHWEFRTDNVLEPHNWSLVANVAYGVTAGLDVQTATNDYLAYRDMVETGQSIGQRAFMTATGIFGHTDFQSYDAAHSYLRRYADHFHVRNIKSYVAGNRKQRQWIVLASQDLGLMPTTEGAADQKLDLTHAIDGMHGNEHNLPDAPIFKDVVELYAQTRTAYTPTLVVQYNAEELVDYFFTRENVHDDAKLRRFYPSNRLDELSQRRGGWHREEEYDFRSGAAVAAKIQRAGGLVGVGGHGEFQGLAYHWEMWAYEMGGMTPAEVLRAATIDGAKIVGIAEDLGSIEVGKLADFVILNSNPLEDIRRTTDIDRVVLNGRVYDGDTMDQQWPEQAPLPPFWWWDDGDARHAPGPVMP